MSKKKADGFTDEEKAAMKERAKELKAEARANKNKAEGETDLLAKIAELPEPERTMAERLHAIIKASAPTLTPKTWYGMPAYANNDGKIVCFFQSAHNAFALNALTPVTEAKISALITQAVAEE